MTRDGARTPIVAADGRIGAVTESVRAADPERDAAACARIYAPFVEDEVASFEEVAPDAAEMARRIAQTSRTHPWLVLERDGELAGFAYGTQHRARAAYRWAADVSVYVDPAHHGRGAGRALYAELLELLRAQGIYTVCAGITLPNPASVALHESFGFALVGVYRGIGFKAGAWRDVGWYQLALRPPDDRPDEPSAPAYRSGE